MAKGSGGRGTGMAALRLYPLPGVPGEVQAAFLLWLTAIAAGVVETVIRVIYSLAGSLVVDPIAWLAAGNPLREVFEETVLLFAFIAPIRTVHLAAVLGALVLMFLLAANDYFRRPSSAAGAPRSPTVTGEDGEVGPCSCEKEAAVAHRTPEKMMTPRLGLHATGSAHRK